MAQRITTSVLRPNSLYNDTFWHGHQTTMSVNGHFRGIAVFGMRHTRTIRPTS